MFVKVGTGVAPQALQMIDKSTVAFPHSLDTSHCIRTVFNKNQLITIDTSMRSKDYKLPLLNPEEDREVKKKKCCIKKYKCKIGEREREAKQLQSTF